jgi:hypothetical protein
LPPDASCFDHHWQVLSALSNAALDDSFASAVLGKKVSKTRVLHLQLHEFT